MTKGSKRLLLTLLVLALVAVAAASWHYRGEIATALALGGGPEEGSSQRPPPRVEVADAERAKVRARIPATGTLVAPEAVTVTAQTAGRIASIRFEEGDRVAAGELLVTLERTRAEAAVEQARARLEQRARDTERKQELAGEDFVSAGALERSEAAREEARAALQIAREDLENRTISAPFAGVTGRRLVSPGALVEPGTPITRLVQTQTLDLLLDVPGTELARLSPGLPVEARSPAYPERTFRGEVTFVGTEVEQATRTLPLEATIENPAGRLKPGMYLQADVLLAEREAVRVPEAALIARGPTQSVYVVGEGGRVERRTVQTGARRSGWVEIRDGLTAGERVVTAGHGALREGMRVRTGESAPGASPPPEASR